MNFAVHIAVLDDEPVMLRTLCRMLHKLTSCTGSEVMIDAFVEGEQLVNAVTDRSVTYDAVFLDVVLDGQPASGLRVAQQLRHLGFEQLVVFVTAHSNYMSEAFSVETFAYVRKSHLRDDLAACLERILRKLGRTRSAKLLLADGGTTTAIAVSDILFVSSARNYCYVHLRSSSIRTKRTLQSFAAELPSFFGQTRRTELVNFEHVVSVHPGHVELDDGTQLPTGPKYRRAVQQKFNELNRT